MNKPLIQTQIGPPCLARCRSWARRCAHTGRRWGAAPPCSCTCTLGGAGHVCSCQCHRRAGAHAPSTRCKPSCLHSSRCQKQALACEEQVQSALNPHEQQRGQIVYEQPAKSGHSVGVGRGRLKHACNGAGERGQALLWNWLS